MRKLDASLFPCFSLSATMQPIVLFTQSPKSLKHQTEADSRGIYKESVAIQDVTQKGNGGYGKVPVPHLNQFYIGLSIKVKNDHLFIYVFI